YRLLIKTMFEEFGECYPLHLGVTEAGDGEDGRIKSAVGIGALLEDGIGDTIRVSLTEDPELEIPVCNTLVARYQRDRKRESFVPGVSNIGYNPFSYNRRETIEISNVGGSHVPIVIADLSKLGKITHESLQSIGYSYNEATDKWAISDTAADYVFTGHHKIDFALPGTLKVIVYPGTWLQIAAAEVQQKEDATYESLLDKYFPIFEDDGYVNADLKSSHLNFVMVDCFNDTSSVNDFTYLDQLANDPKVVLCLSSTNKNAMQSVRRMFIELMNRKIKNPVVIIVDSNWNTADEHLIHYATEAGALLLDGMGDGVCFGMSKKAYDNFNSQTLTGRQYNPTILGVAQTAEQFINNTAFIVLQATRTRISKTEYISCPSCGRTLFDLQETTAKIRAVTNHLKGVKIAIMGCIVNGPGEMADADFGYVGSGPGKITLYKGKEVVKRNVPSEIAVEELINLLKENSVWVEPARAGELIA
ncbi:MAG TPA: flavodoxin-dependent (E)-4-hydroxy-3-methylbut-2-enyl-diphosphate synthase, partial [Chitinophagaceae bacterium]